MPLAYKSFGEGTPILFVHGWELNNDYDIADFEPIFAHAPGYRRIYVDLPGMGATPADASIVDLQSMFDKIVAFIDQQISPSKFLLVGSSAGGYIARALATQFESQILGVLLKVPLIEPENSRRDLDVAKVIIEDQVAMRLALEGQTQSLGQILVQTPAYIRSLLAKMSATVFPADAMANHEVLDIIRNDQKRYSLDLIEKRREVVISKPSLIITGRHDDVTGYRDALRLLDIYPRATFVALDRGIHLLPIDEGDLVRSLVLDWLRRVDESSKQQTGASV
jgi:pimeloyl-ACP methyl ester carboxylesterase